MSPITKKNDDYSFGTIYNAVSHDYWNDSFFLLQQIALIIGLTCLYIVYLYFH